MSDGRDRGLEESPAFSAYQSRLCETWPENADLAEKYGVPAVNGRSTEIDMSESQNDENEAQLYDTTKMGRRAFTVGAATAIAASATAGKVMADEVAENKVPNFESEYTHNPYIPASVTIDEHTEEMEPLEFVNNSGEVVSLADYGGVLAARGDEDEPHNPVRFLATKIETDEFRDFPRDGEREDSDGDIVDVSALDADLWDADSNLDVEDDGDALELTTDGLADGDSASATFDLDEFDAVIDSGIARKYVQAVVDVDYLDASADVTVTIGNDTDSVEVMIDPDADADADDVIADSVQDGVVFQTEIGDLDGGTDLESIEAIEIDVADGDASLRFAGLNLERESRWEFGTRERLDDDNELEETTLFEPVGYTGIVGLEGLLEQFGDAGIEDIEYEIEFVAGEAPEESWEVEVSEPDRGDFEQVFNMVGGFGLPGGYYDLEIDAQELIDQARHPSSRYDTVEISVDESEIPGIDDVDDVEWTDRTSTLQDASTGEEVTLSNTVSASNVVAIHYEIHEDSDIIGEMWTEPGAAGGALFGSGGGVMSSVWGWALAIVTGVAGAIALARRRASSAVGR